MKSSKQNTKLYENGSFERAANDPESIENKKKQNELKAIADHNEAYIDYLKQALFQHFREIQERRKEFEDIQKKYSADLKNQFEVLWNAYLDKQNSLSKISLIEYQELLKKQLADLLQFLQNKIDYLNNFIYGLNKELNKIKDRMDQRIESIIQQYIDEIRKNYPPKIVDKVIEHLDETSFQRFRNKQIPAAQLQHSINEELASAELNNRILEAYPDTEISRARFAASSSNFISRFDGAAQNNVGLQEAVISHTDDEQLLKIHLDLIESAQKQLDSCHKKVAILAGVCEALEEKPDAKDDDISLESLKHMLEETTNLMNGLNSDHAIEEVSIKSLQEKSDQLASQSQLQHEKLAKLGEEAKSQVDNTSIKFR